MTRLYLPFSMAKQTVVNPLTFEPQIIGHPFLDIGSSFSTLHWHIRVWLDENMKDDYTFGFDNSQSEYFIEFKNEKDKTFFLLRWT